MTRFIVLLLKRMRLVTLALLFLASIPLQAAKGTINSVGPNIPVVPEHPQDRQQVEPTIAVDPRNPNILVAGAQDYRLKAAAGHRWHGYYRSVDGGTTWTDGLLPGFPGDTSTQGLASPLHRFNTTSDPVLAFDRFGNVYYTGIAFNILSSGACCFDATAFVAKFTNDGADYSNATLVQGVTDADKQWIAVDTTGGPNDGNIYLAFDAAIGNQFATVFTRSTDGGRTFSTPFFVPADMSGELPGVTVAPNGDVFVSTPAYDPITGADLHKIEVSRLTDGGATLAGTTVAASSVGSLPSPLPGNSFRTFTIPQIASDYRGVYVVWDNWANNNADVFFARSTDSGTTWTTPLRINDLTLDHQFFPTITVSAGTISVAWFDARLNGGAVPISSLDLFYAQSTNGGASFSPNVRVTSVSFNPNIVKRTDAPNNNEPFMGDYLSITATSTSVYPIWPDNRNACDTVDPVYGCVDQDVFTAKVSVTPPAAVHDVAAVGMSASRNFAYNNVPSNPLTVNVTVTNQGTVPETFTATALANSTVIGTQTVSLVAGASNTVKFSWNTSPLPVGAYVLTAQASQVSGETSLANNVFTDGPFAERFQGDVDGSCKVDILDLASIAFAYGSRPGSLRWNPAADLNNDLFIDIVDIAYAAIVYYQSCP